MTYKQAPKTTEICLSTANTMSVCIITASLTKAGKVVTDENTGRVQGTRERAAMTHRGVWMGAISMFSFDVLMDINKSVSMQRWPTQTSMGMQAALKTHNMYPNTSKTITSNISLLCTDKALECHNDHCMPASSHSLGCNAQRSLKGLPHPGRLPPQRPGS